MLARGLLITALFGATSVDLMAQGVAEVAAREKERRKQAAKAGASRVFTNEDLLAYAGERTEAASADPATEDQAKDAKEARHQAAPRPATADAAQSGKANMAAQYKASLTAADAYVKQAEGRLREAEAHWHFVNSHTNQSDPLSEARSRLQAATKEAERAKKQRDDVADAARREGIPPGSLR